MVYISDLIEYIPATRVCRASNLILIEEELLELQVSAIHRRVHFHLDRGQTMLGTSSKHVINLQRKNVRSTLKLHTLRAGLELEHLNENL